MKKGINFLVLALIGLSVIGCQKVPAGYKGVKVYLLGGEKGVDHEELGVGRYWIGINEELYLFPTFKQNYAWTQNPTEGSPNDESITFQTKGGMEVGADVGITYSILPDKVSDVFTAYRRGVHEITDVFLRNAVRDAFVDVASTMDVESVYGSGKTAMVDEVQKRVALEVSPIGIQIEKIYLIGKLRLPPTVVAALNAKIEATQKAQQRENEIRQAEAEAKKKIAEAQGEAESMKARAKGQAEATLVNAKAQAEANRLLSKSLTKELVEYEKATRWDGKLPQVTGGTPLINFSSSESK